MIFAVVDIGSHTLRLAIYERKNELDFLLTKTKHALGLAGFLKDEVMTEDGILTLLEHLKKFRKFLDAFNITDVYAFATAALRMSKNKAEILGRVKKETGFEINVLSGEEEAEFAFIGATKNSPVKSGALFDIGGGSTEIVRFDGKEILKEYSLPIGAVSLAKKYNAEFFPDFDARKKIADNVADELLKAKVDIKATDAIALGGAAKGAKILLGKEVYEPINLEDLINLETRLKSPLSVDDKTLLLRETPDRAHILIAGFCILIRLMQEVNCERFYYLSGGVREGFIDKRITTRGVT